MNNLNTDKLFLYKIVSRKIKTNRIEYFSVHIPNKPTRFVPIFHLPAVTSNIEFFSRLFQDLSVNIAKTAQALSYSEILYQS